MFGDFFDDFDFTGVPELGNPSLQPAAAVERLKDVLRHGNAQWILFRAMSDALMSGDNLDAARIYASCWVGCRLLVSERSTPEEVRHTLSVT